MSTKNATFEKNMLRLEEIVEKMNNNVALDEALDLFEEADKLVRQCQKKLDDAQNRIEKIVQSRSDNQASPATGGENVFLEAFDPIA